MRKALHPWNDGDRYDVSRKEEREIANMEDYVDVTIQGFNLV